MPTDKGVSLKVDFLGTLFSVYTFDIKKKGLTPWFLSRYSKSDLPSLQNKE